LTTFAVQYLESPYPDATPAAVRRQLRQACERLPISLVLLGWDLPTAVEEAVAQETARQHGRLFRWLPLLTGDAHTDIPPEWSTLGPSGNRIQGHGGLPEFSFICPNRSSVVDFLTERVDSVAASGLFQGLFLDRIRFPSPAIDPLRDLACFCTYCNLMAADTGLDLDAIRRDISVFPPEVIVRNLLGQSIEADLRLKAFLDFRSESISRAVQRVIEQAHLLNLSIGLDCFSPALTRMVGQNLSALDRTAEWVKIMTYPRVFGPAGIPFELLGLANWLIHSGLREVEAMRLLAEASGLPVPVDKAGLSLKGLGSDTISQEIQRGYKQGLTNLLAGVPLVRMQNIHESTPEQIQADLEACRGADGLVISWDLWFTPLEYLDHIRTLWS
jgi:hypothetical protein